MGQAFATRELDLKLVTPIGIWQAPSNNPEVDNIFFQSGVYRDVICKPYPRRHVTGETGRV